MATSHLMIVPLGLLASRQCARSVPEGGALPKVTGGISRQFSSRGALTYPGHGMHLHAFAAREWKGLDGYWLRAELWRDDNGFVRGSTYRRERGYWREHHDQALAMTRDQMLKETE